jgi:hypothetical protein
MPFDPKPPHDCRLTARCLKALLGFPWPLEKDLATLRSENSVVEEFIDLRENDERGGEGGERVRQIRTRPAFKFTYGRMRGATWFEKNRPPQGIVWLLGAENHDERHKGRLDAYDILARLEVARALFPIAIDYKRLELDRRRRDTETIAAEVRRDAAALFAAAVPGGGSGTVAGVPVRLVVESDEDGVLTVYVAVSERAVRGRYSGLMFDLTEKRFLGIQEGFRLAFDERFGPPVLIGELRDRSAFPGGLRWERPFVAMVER